MVFNVTKEENNGTHITTTTNLLTTADGTATGGKNFSHITENGMSTTGSASTIETLATGTSGITTNDRSVDTTGNLLPSHFHSTSKHLLFLLLTTHLNNFDSYNILEEIDCLEEGQACIPPDNPAHDPSFVCCDGFECKEFKKRTPIEYICLP